MLAATLVPVAMGARPANPGGLVVGVVYLGIALAVFVAARRDADSVLGGSAAVTMALAGAIALYLGWTRRTVRWTEERTRRRRVTVYVLVTLTVPIPLLVSIDAAVSSIG